MSLKSVVRSLGRRRRKHPDPFLVTRQLVQRERPVIFDVGAHRGETALRYRALFPGAAIHSFEPSPGSYRTLATAAGSTTGIETHCIALSDAAGTAVLNVNRSAATSSLLPSAPAARLYWGDGLLDTQDRIEVPTQTLDGFCADRRIDAIDVLKLDVQGAEHAVLRGASLLLAGSAIDVIYMELIIAPTYVGQHKLHEYLGLFAEHGYELFDLYNPVRRRERLIQADALIVSAPCLEHYERAAQS